MNTITNISNVNDYFGDTPIATPSNPVTTVIRDMPCRYCCECNCCCRCRCRCRNCRCCYECRDNCEY